MRYEKARSHADQRGLGRVPPDQFFAFGDAFPKLAPAVASRRFNGCNAGYGALRRIDPGFSCRSRGFRFHNWESEFLRLLGSSRRAICAAFLLFSAPLCCYCAAVKLLLVDGHYYAYRSFFAIRELSNSLGEPTNAIYGFIKVLRKMLKDLQPTHAAVLWDEGLPEHRMLLQPEYKQQRAEMPDLMKPQIGHIRRLVPLLGIQSLGRPNTEADDLMATYACEAIRTWGAECETVLATNDKDLFQLVADGVKVYTTNKTDLLSPKDGFALLDAQKVREKWSVNPEQIGDVLCLVGDSADNIPGVEGIGPKRAVALIQEFGNVDAIVANVAKIKNEGIRQKIATSLDRIKSNQQMVKLDTNVPLPAPLDALTIRPRYDELLAEIGRWEFKTLTQELRTEAARARSQGELFGSGAPARQTELF